MTEIRYTIDPKESDETQTLALCLIEYPEASSRPLMRSVLYKLSPQDKEVLDLLIQSELDFQKQMKGRAPPADAFSFALVHIKPSSVLEVLKQVGATGKLYFGNKQLTPDLYGRAEFYYQAVASINGALEINGHFKWRETDIPLKDCDWIGIGKPAWFIRGISLKILSTDISSKELKKLYYQPTILLEGVAKQQFLESLDPEDPESPRLILTGQESQDFHKNLEPFPLLLLKDRVGASADLWMDYKGHGILFNDRDEYVKDEKGKKLFKRNINIEKTWEKDLLETGFSRKEMGTSSYFCSVDQVSKSLTFLLEIGWLIKDWKGNQIIRQSSLDLEANQNPQHIVIKGRARFEDHEANLTDIMGSFNRRDHFVQLGEGKIGLLSSGEENSFLQDLSDGEIVSEGIRFKRSHLGSLASLFQQARVAPDLQEAINRLSDFSGIAKVEPTSSFQGQLRPYQSQGLNWLNFLYTYGFHGILADDMGLGKTVQILALLSRLSLDKPHLIVVPTSLLFNWKKEFETFLPSIIPYIHHGPLRLKTSGELEQKTVIITSYATLRLDLPIMQSVHFHSIFLDEAQIIKNSHTQVAQALYNLHADFRLSISGTPVENHLKELWSQFHFLMPDLLGEEEAFASDIRAAEADQRYLQRIKKRISPFILRRKKEDVAKDLPERIEQVVWVDMGEEQRAVYDHFMAGFKQNLLKKVELEGMQKHRMEVLEAILRLRQICCHPYLVSSLTGEEPVNQSAKLDVLWQDIETAIEEGQKVLIYSQFTSMLKIMTNLAKEKGWKFSYLDGSTADREKVVSDFQNEKDVSLFFISLKAGGVGLNLTAADYVFLYDPWWNTAVEEQAINRAHRIGRKNTVIAKRFVTVETIEEKMMKLKASKQSVIENIFELESKSDQLSIEDLQFLFS